MQRPIWKGFITFGLVNIPVILYSAEKKSDIQFKLLDSRDKSRIRYVRINEQTGEEVPWEEIAKGYEYNDHDFVLIKDDDIKEMAGQNSKTINIECFIDKKELDSVDFEKPYYLLPDKKGEKGYVILRETLRETKKIGISKVIIHTREYLAALMPYKDALILNLLRYHEELRNPEEYDLPQGSLKNYKISPKELEIAKQLVASMTTKWEPLKFHDEFRKYLHHWIDEKIKKEKHPGKKAKKSESAPVKSTNVVDFVDLLKKSLQNKKNKSNVKKRSR